MKLTAIEMQQLKARRRMPTEPPKRPHRRDKRPTCTVTPEERQKRHDLLMRALEGCDSVTDLAARLGTERANVSKWVNGKRPVPQKHLGKLEEIAWRHHG